MAAPGTPTVLALVGPTGSGKSALAMRLARELPIEIVSVDSALVYRGMYIGTAKPTPAEQAAVRHHLINLREPEARYSAGEFRRDCLEAIRDIAARGRVPVLVGGTMLYFRAVFRGIAELPPADPALRAALDARAAVEGWPALHAQLAQRDPDAAARIHPNDAQRIQRALELLTQQGGRGSVSDAWRERAVPATAIDWRVVVLEPADRTALHEQLAVRLDAMLAAGFVDEVRRLLTRGTLHPDSPSMRAVGYRQLLAFCDGREPFPVARDKALYATRQLAKRQLTWLRSDGLLPPGTRPLNFDSLHPETAERFLAATLQSLAQQP
jgi:tRNA dimethylallyltransferase